MYNILYSCKTRCSSSIWLIYLCFLSCLFPGLSAQTVAPNTGSGQDDVLMAGAAKAIITPPQGSIMGNSYGTDICKGIHDDLHARALVFEKSGVKASFIALDLVSIPHVVVMETRKLINQHTGIPVNNIIMTATHAHAGPQMNPLFWKTVGGVPMQKSREYLKDLPGMITGSVVAADSRLRPVTVSAGNVKESSINFNRRFLMKDGSFRMNPGRLNPNAVRSAGPVDPDVSVVYIESTDLKPVALLVNFALHPAIVTGNRISADFPAVVSDLLAKVMGEEMITVYTNGTSGNINHVDVNWREQPDGFSESARIGTIIAADVLKALSTLQRIDVNDLRVNSRVVELPVPSVKTGDIEWARNVINRYGKPDAPSFNDVVKAWRLIDLEVLKGGEEARHMATTTVPLKDDGSALISEVQVIKLGNELALVGFPGDAFVELGLAIKQNSPFPFTIVCEQSGNGSISYVPNRKAIQEGGYEGESARFLPGGGELLVDAALLILIEMFPYRGAPAVN